VSEVGPTFALRRQSQIILVVNTRSCNWRAGKPGALQHYPMDDPGTSSVQGMARSRRQYVFDRAINLPRNGSFLQTLQSPPPPFLHFARSALARRRI